MGKYILVAESGSDIPAELAEKYGIRIVPMHVNFEETTKDDGSFPIEEIFTYYERTGKLPKTSGCTPDDFEKVFDDIYKNYPDRHILHLAYSAVTTCSYQSAQIASAERNTITSIDTKKVTIGQGMIVMAAAHYLEKNPDCPLEDIVNVVNRLCRDCRLCFFPGDLAYMKAGGRVSNAAYMGAKILSLSPLIELQDGKLVATKKYRGKMEKNALRLLEDYAAERNLGKQFIAFGYSPGLEQQIILNVTEKAKQMGFEKIGWFQTGCVISTHAGPGGFGICGFSESCI